MRSLANHTENTSATPLERGDFRGSYQQNTALINNYGRIVWEKHTYFVHLWYLCKKKTKRFHTPISKTLAIVIEKGGVGKTTTSMNLAASLATLEKKVLLVDADPQANASSGMGIDVSKIEHSIYNALLGQVDIRDIIYTTDIEGLDIVPSHINLVGAEIELLDFKKQERIMKDVLSPIAQDYDYILIDCSPSLGLITVNALTAANSVIIPLQCEYFALEGIRTLLTTINNVS